MLNIENTNHPQTYYEFDPVPKPYMPINPNPNYGEDYGDLVRVLHQLSAEPGLSDCPWMTWDECINDTLSQIFGCRLQDLCNNRRIRGEIFD